MFLLLFAIVIAAFIAFLIKVIEAYQPENLRKRSRRRVGTSPASPRTQPKRDLQAEHETERQSYVKRETETLLYAMCGGDRNTAERLASHASGDTLQARWEQAIAQLTRDRR